METIPEQIKRARTKAGLTQAELAILAGVTQNNISRLEHGKLDMRLSKLDKIAAALQLELIVSPLYYHTQVYSLIHAGDEADDLSLMDKYGVPDDED